MTSRHERQDRDGFALVDELLDACRALDPLPAAAHVRVKRRLQTQAARRARRAFPWVQFAVAGITMLICGGAFGIALERLVLHPRPSTQGKTGAAERSRKTSAGGSKHATTPTGTEASRVELARVEGLPAVHADAPALPAPVPATTGSAPIQAGTPPRTGSLLGASPEPATPVRKLALRDPALASAPARAWPAPPSYAAAPALPSPPSPQAAWPASPSPPSSLGTVEAPMPAPAVAPAPPAAAPSVTPSSERANATRAAAPAAPPAAAELPSEERLLAMAVRALRADKNPASALAALDEYRGQYRHGRFAVEATILRVDAMLALGRRDEALPLLDGLDLSRVPGGTERQLQRGELRAQAGRWDEARADYDGVLANGSERDSSLLERAASGRIEACRHLGDEVEARRAAAQYLRRFPHGRFAPQAKILLGPDAP